MQKKSTTTKKSLKSSIKPAYAVCVIDKNNPKININWCVPLKEKKNIVVSKNEKIISVMIYPDV